MSDDFQKRTKNGHQNQHYLENSPIVSLFSCVSKALTDSKLLPESSRLDVNTIAKVTCELLRFMEVSLGKFSPVATRSLTKIPLKAFQDYTSDGALYIILLTALTYQVKAGWDLFDLTIIERNTDGLSILQSIESTLQEAKKLVRPRVFFGQVTSENIQDLTQIVEKHGGSVVDAADNASHIIDSDETIDSLPSDLPEDYLRIVDIFLAGTTGAEKPTKTLIHWMFHPDSYDEYIDTNDIQSEPNLKQNQSPSSSSVDKQWHVCCRYIYDCDTFNEWGNEADYENETLEGNVDEVKSNSTSHRQYAASKAKRKIVESQATAMDVVNEVNDEKNDVVGNSERAAAAESDAGSTSAAIASNTGVKRKADIADEKGNETAALTSGKHKKSSRKSHQSQLKSPAWFNPLTVNFLEIKNLPEFFTNTDDSVSKTEEYTKIRNFIVNLYSSNPYTYLSATECRKRVAGDVCVILKIHNFLDSFGVINFNVKSDCRPTLSTPSALSSTAASVGVGASSTSSDVASSSSGSNIPMGCDTATSSTVEDDSWSGDWSSEMDRTLLGSVLSTQGDWAAVACALRAGCSEQDPCTPSQLECLARLIFLPSAPAPSRSVFGSEGSKAALRTQLLSAEIAGQMGVALGCSAAQGVVSRATDAMREDSNLDLDSVAMGSVLSNRELRVAVAVGAAAVVALAKHDSEAEQGRLKSLLSDYVLHRMAALEEKMKLLIDVDRMIDLEKERLEVDRRDTQILRAQLAFKLLSQMG